MDPDQTAPLGALFAYMQNVSLKSLQEDAADDISRRHFQMQIFLALKGLTSLLCFRNLLGRGFITILFSVKKKNDF